jgi:Uma2 family endonuclease
MAPGNWPGDNMTTTTQNHTVQQLEAVARRIRGGDRYQAYGVAWQDVQQLRETLRQENHHLRYGYRAGVLAFMPTSLLHEFWKKTLAILIEQYCSAMRQDFCAVGSPSLDSETLDVGMLPDESYCFRDVPQVVARLTQTGELILPDLVVEVEYSRELTSRLPILADLGVPEVWRFDGTLLSVLRLQPNQQYLSVSRSEMLSGFPVHEVPRMLEIATREGHLAMKTAFLALIIATMEGA